VGPQGPGRLAASLHPTLLLGLAPDTTPVLDRQGTKRDQATELPACRADTELRPLETARSCRFDEPAWGTHEDLGRGAVGPQSPGQGKRPGDFDPKELFGAAWWLTPLRDTGAAQATGATPLVPRVTIQEAYPSFRGEFLLLTFEAIEWFGVIRLLSGCCPYSCCGCLGDLPLLHRQALKQNVPQAGRQLLTRPPRRQGLG
jgi:hypothetical protein